MVLDAVLAIAITLVIFQASFTDDQLIEIQQVAAPGLFLTVYAFAWVRLLGARGLYRPRARWSFRSEALAVTKDSHDPGRR